MRMCMSMHRPCWVLRCSRGPGSQPPSSHVWTAGGERRQRGARARGGGQGRLSRVEDSEHGRARRVGGTCVIFANPLRPTLRHNYATSPPPLRPSAPCPPPLHYTPTHGLLPFSVTRSLRFPPNTSPSVHILCQGFHKVEVDGEGRSAAAMPAPLRWSPTFLDPSLRISREADGTFSVYSKACIRVMCTHPYDVHAYGLHTRAAGRMALPSSTLTRCAPHTLCSTMCPRIALPCPCLIHHYVRVP